MQELFTAEYYQRLSANTSQRFTANAHQRLTAECMRCVVLSDQAGDQPCIFLLLFTMALAPSAFWCVSSGSGLTLQLSVLVATKIFSILRLRANVLSFATPIGFADFECDAGF